MINVRKLAVSSGINEKALMRLTGSVKIPVIKGNEEKLYDIGLRLKEFIDKLETHDRSSQAKSVAPWEEMLTRVLREYSTVCPMIIGWSGRGDFNPKKIPESIKIASILHGVRSAGRLRAKFLREMSKVYPWVS